MVELPELLAAGAGDVVSCRCCHFWYQSMMTLVTFGNNVFFILLILFVNNIIAH